MIKILKPDFVFEDERGSLVQLVREGYKQINVVVSKAGYERGRHGTLCDTLSDDCRSQNH